MLPKYVKWHQGVVRGFREGVRVEAPKGPLGYEAAGREADRGGFRLPARYQDRMRDDADEDSRGGGGGGQRQ